VTTQTQTLSHYERAAEITERLLAEYRAGDSIAALAEKHGLRRDAIAGELARYGIGRPSPARERVLDFVRKNPGLSIDDIALRLDLAKSSVSRYLRGAEEHKLVVSRKTNPITQYTDAQMAEALRAAFKKLPDRSKGLSRKQYAKLMKDENVPAAATFIRRYGSWSEACTLAGIAASPSRRGTYTREWTNDQIIDAVIEFIDTTGSTAYHPYARWATEHGKPSGPLLVTRLGGWADARRLAITRQQEQQLAS
jgi:transcriptional regulator with XRE-family HTH domain